MCYGRKCSSKMNIIFAVTLLFISSTWASELNRSKKQINFGSDDDVKEGYFYNKPSISFDLPTQKPSATTVSPTPTGYNYPKPSIKFEENPKPIVIGVTPSKNFGSGGGQTSVTSTFNKYEFNKPRVEIETKKPSSFGIFGSGGSTITSNVNRYDISKPSVGVNVFGSGGGSSVTTIVNKVNEQKTNTFATKFPSVGITKLPSFGTTGSGQSSFESTSNKYDYNKPKIEIAVPKPVGQTSFGIFGTGVQKTTSQSTFGSSVSSGGISGGGQTSFVSTVNKYDYNKPKIDLPKPTLKPLGQTSFGVFGTGVQKTTSQSTFGSSVPSGGISGSGQTSFVSTVNKYDYNKPKIDLPKPTPKPVGQTSFGVFGTGVQKTTSQSTYGSSVPSGAISGGGQTSFVSSVNKYDYNKPKIDIVQTKPAGQSAFGGFGTGVQKATSQSTFGSSGSSGGISGGGQTSFVSTINKYDYNKPKIDLPKPTLKPLDQTSFGVFGTGVQKTTSQSTFGSSVPSGGISGGGQTSFVSTVNKYDYNKPKIDIVQTKPAGQSAFGVFGTGVQKTTSQSTFGSSGSSGGISGGGQTSFVSTVNKYDYNKPKIDIVQTKPAGQSAFGVFGTGVQKTTSQSTFGSSGSSGGISGGGQTSFVSTANKYDYNKPKIDLPKPTPKPVGQTSFGVFGTGVQKTTSQSTFGSSVPSGGISGGGQTSFVSTVNKYDYNKPKIDIVQTKPAGQSAFGVFGTGVQKTTSQSTFGSSGSYGGISGGGQTSFVSTVNKYDYNKPKIDIVQTKPAGQSAFGVFGTGVQKTTSQSTFGSSVPSGGISGGGQTSFVSTVNKYDYNKPKIDIVQTKPAGQSAFGVFGTGVQKTTSQSTFGSSVPSGGISGGGQTSFVSTVNKYDYNKPKIDIVQTKPAGQSAFGVFGTGIQKTTSQSTFGSSGSYGGISGGGQTSFVSTVNKYDYNKPKIDIVQTKPAGQSAFGVFGTGVQKTTSQSTFGSSVPSGGISGGGQTSFVSTVNKYDYNKPKIDIVQTKPAGQSAFGVFGTGVQKTTSQSTFGSSVPSGGISGGGQTSFVSTVNKYDYNKPKIDIVQTKPAGQSAFGVFGTGIQKTTSQSTFGSSGSYGGISGGGQTSFVSTVNKYDYNKPKIDIVQTKPAGQSAFGVFGTGVQKTTSQSTFGSSGSSGGISGGGQTSFVSSVNKYDYNKPKINIVQTKPAGQSAFGVFGTGVQKTTSQSTFGSSVPSGGISGGGQTSFVSTVNKYDYNKSKIDLPNPTLKPLGQTSFGVFGTGVQKTTSQSTFGSSVPSGRISGGGQTSFVSTVNKYDYNKPKIDLPKPTPKPLGQTSFGVFGTGVQKTTSQNTFGSSVPSGGFSGGGQTSFVSTVNKYDYNKPKIDLPKPTPKPVGQTSFGVFGTGVQKTTSQTTFGSSVPSGGISGGGQTSFVSTVNKYDYNKPKIDLPKPTPKPLGQTSFGVFGTGVQKTTSQNTFGSSVPSGGFSGGGQTSFVSTVNKYDYNKPKIDLPKPTPKPVGQTSFGVFGTGVQKTTSQTTFGSSVPSGGISGGGQTSFVSTVNKYDYNKPKIDLPKPTPKPLGQTSFGVFGTGVQKTTSQNTFGSSVPSGGFSGGGQTSFVSTVNKYDYNKPKIDLPKPTPKPVGQTSFGVFGTGVQKTTSQTTFGSSVPSGGISGGGQTSFVSTVNKYDYNKPKIDLPKPTPKPLGQTSFGVFGTGVQKTTSQNTFGSSVPSGGFSGGGQTSFVSTVNKYDYNKPKIDLPKPTPKPVGQTSFGVFGTGVQKTTSQTTFGSSVPSGGISGGGQTSFVSTVNKYDYNKPKIDLPKPTLKPLGQTSFGVFGTGVQKTTSQNTFGSSVPSGGFSGGGQTSFVSTVNKYDYNKPKIDLPKPTSKPVGQTSFGVFGTGVQKTTSQSTFGSSIPSGGISGGGQTSFVSTVNKYDYNKPKIDIVQTKPSGQSTFGVFGTGVQKTTSQSTFGSSVPSGGISGVGQTSFVSNTNRYDFDKPKIDLPKATPKPVGQTSFGVFGTGGTSFNTQKTTSTFSSKFPSTGSGQTSIFSNVNKYEVNKPRAEFSTSKPTTGSSFGLFGGGSGSRFGSTVNSQAFDYSTQRPSTNAPEYLPPLGSTFQKIKYNDDIKYF